MVTVRLNRGALDYVVSALAGEGGIASSIQTELLFDPILFAPRDCDVAELPPFDAGGVATQELADKELVSYIRELKKKNFGLCSIIFHDPWSQEGDLDYAGPPQSEMVTMDGRIYYSFNIADFTWDAIGECRARSVSFLKLIYVSELSAGKIRMLMGARSSDLCQTLARSIRHVVVNAFDDESWIVVQHGHPD